jgi:hypothetical protein
LRQTGTSKVTGSNCDANEGGWFAYGNVFFCAPMLFNVL